MGLLRPPDPATISLFSHWKEKSRRMIPGSSSQAREGIAVYGGSGQRAIHPNPLHLMDKQSGNMRGHPMVNNSPFTLQVGRTRLIGIEDKSALLLHMVGQCAR